MENPLLRKNTRSWLKLLLLVSDEAIAVCVVLFVLWELGVRVNAGVLVAIASILAVIVFLLHRALWPVLSDRQAPNPSGMVGLYGEALGPLSPDGVVKVRGELWKATATDSEVEVGQQVRVVGLEGLTLLVEMTSADMGSGVSSV